MNQVPEIASGQNGDHRRAKLRAKKLFAADATGSRLGSRRGLLEAVFDDIARRGGLQGLGDAMAMPNPYAALDRVVEIFCAFWNRDPAVGRLHEAMATDPEFAQALIERNERRRRLVRVIVERIAAKTASRRARQDAVDLIFALTSHAMFAMLNPGRSMGEVCHAIGLPRRLEPLSPGRELIKLSVADRCRQS